MKLVGREKEFDQLKKTLSLNRNLLIEGPVGVGKTFLVQSALQSLKKKFYRVDGDTRYTEQKLTGWFDPPLVLKKGYQESCFIPGPLLEAMRNGAVLFINELNRMPEAVQNILLPSMDEHELILPKLGPVKAKAGFCVVATQNPREFTATHALSEALMDRFEMLQLSYQSEDEERDILKAGLSGKKTTTDVSKIVSLIRATRNHPGIKRGASVRAGIAIADLMVSGLSFETACLMALPSRIELVSAEENFHEILNNLLSGDALKKKSL